MKTSIIKILALILVVASLSACDKKFGAGVKLKGIQVGDALSLNMGSTATTPAYPIPWDCTDYEFTYTSSNPEVATVSEFGKITAIDPGDCVITITCGDKKAEVNVNVYEITIGQALQELDGLTGLWEFNADAPMKATVGKDLVAYSHGYYDADGNRVVNDDELGEKTDEGWSSIVGFNKRDGAVKTLLGNSFYCVHGLSNPTVYTLVIDALRPASSDGKYTSFVNVATNNSSDQSIYLRKGGEVQFGASGNRSSNAISNDKWYRFVFVKNANEYMRIYVNTALWKDGTALDNRSVLEDVACLLDADNDGDDQTLLWSTAAFFNRCLTESEIMSLGSL